MNGTQPNLDAALRYAELGYPVFPCRAGAKTPSTPHGFKDASTDAAVITQWWKREPDANVAIATGGLVVIDRDGAGNPWLRGDPDKQSDLGGAPLSITPRGGCHHVFRAPEGLRIGSSVKRLAPNVDVRAEGGYILVPPSVVGGVAYRWADTMALDEPRDRLPVPPTWLVEELVALEIGRACPPSLADAAGGPPGAIPEGSRNSHLASLAGSMRRRGMGEEEIGAALLVTNQQRCQPPLPEKEVRGVVRSVCRYGAEPGAAQAANLAEGPRTDLGNAERFASLYRDRLRFCHAYNYWLVWDGTRWKKDDAGTARLLAGEMARAMLRSAAGIPDPDKRQEAAKWALKCESKARIDAAIDLAKSQPGLIVDVGDLDTDPMLFNVMNGTLDLRTGMLGQYQREDLITKVAPVVYDAEARHELFSRFLTRIFDCDPALIAYVQRFLGYALTGDISDATLPIFYGTGGNGKNVLLDTVLGIMGEYACPAPPQLLTESRSQEHPTEIADLCGRRLVIASETEEGAVFKLQMVKRLTGDQVLKGRFMRCDYFSFNRTHKTILVTNNKPRVKEDSPAVWRRLRLVPFTVTIPEAEQDKQLMSKLVAEYPGVLNFLVRGCLEWRKSGLAAPARVVEATSDYRDREDQLGRFLEEQCEVDDQEPRARSPLFTPWAAFVREYESWADRIGEHPLGGRRLGEALDKRGYPSVTRRFGGPPVKGRAGISVRNGEMPPV